MGEKRRFERQKKREALKYYLYGCVVLIMRVYRAVDCNAAFLNKEIHGNF